MTFIPILVLSPLPLLPASSDQAHAQHTDRRPRPQMKRKRQKKGEL